MKPSMSSMSPAPLFIASCSSPVRPSLADVCTSCLALPFLCVGLSGSVSAAHHRLAGPRALFGPAAVSQPFALVARTSRFQPVHQCQHLAVRPCGLHCAPFSAERSAADLWRAWRQKAELHRPDGPRRKRHRPQPTAFRRRFKPTQRHW